MKVALLHFVFAEYTTSLANALADFADVTLIHPQKITDDCVRAADPRVKIRTFHKPRLRSLSNMSAMNALIDIIKQEQPDVLHLQANGEFWFELALLLNRLPPMVTTVHDVSPHPGDKSSYVIPGSRYTARLPLYRSKQIIVHARHQQQFLTQERGLAASKVQVVSIGEYGTIYRQWARGKTQKQEPYTLLFFGRIWPYKGLRHLIDAMPIVIDEFPEAKLIIAGSGEDLASYFPNGVDRQHYEIIKGFIPYSEVAGLFQRSAISVLPYIEASQSGVAAASYGLGTPVIASDVGGLGELVHDGEDGLLVPPADPQALAQAIIRLLGDTGLQTNMREAALQRSQTDLSWATIAQQTIATYELALGSKS